MRARVKGFHSPDVHDLESYFPPDPQNLAVLVQILVTNDAGLGEDSFDVLICTPAWVADRVRETGIVDGRHHLIVNRWDWQAISQYLRGKIASLEAEDWESLAPKVGRIGRWEFEDYKAFGATQ